MKVSFYNYLKGLTVMLLAVTLGSVSLSGQACPSAPTIGDVDFSPTDPPCTSGGNYAISNIAVSPATPGSGYQYKYSLDGGAFVTNTVFSGIAPGAHCLKVQVFATSSVSCGGNNYVAGDSIRGTSRLYGIYLGNAGPVALTGPQLVGNLTCSDNITPTGPVYSCWDYEYQLDGAGAWVNQGWFAVNILNRGCHSIRYRLVPKVGVAGFFGCGTGNPTPVSNATNFVLFDNLSDDNITVSTTCTVDDSGSGAVTSITGLPTLSTGLTYEYSFDGGTYGTTYPTNLTPGCHNVMIRQKADCGGSVADGDSPSACRKSYNFVVYPQPPVITATANTCNAMFDYPSVTAVEGFSVEYSIDGGDWSATASTTTPGCHSIRARYVLDGGCATNATTCDGCYDEMVDGLPSGIFATNPPTNCGDASNAVSVVIFPTAPDIDAPDNTCNSAFVLPSVTAVDGFTVQYSINGGTYAIPGSLTIPTTPGCHTVEARYVLTNACGDTPANTAGTGLCGESNSVSVVVFPTAPVITAPTSTCNSMFTLPTVTAVTGFSVEYSIDNGANWSSSPSSTTPGCYDVLARYVLTSACGDTPAGTAGTDACGSSNKVNTVIFPTAPTLSAPTPTCDAMFTLPTVAPVSGFSVEYELNDSGTWEASPSTTLAGCYTIKARYVTDAACGLIAAGTAGSDASCAESTSVSTLIYPKEPVILAPANTCNAAFTLPPVNSYTGFTVEYSIDGGAYSSMATAPSSIGCHTVKARYVNTALCGSTPANTPGTLVGADCDESNEVSVVVFPTAPVIGFGDASTTTSTVCESSTLPSVYVMSVSPEAGDFDLEYSSDNGGTWYTDLSSFQASMDLPGCYTIKTKWTLDGDCGSTLDGTDGNTANASCGASNAIYLVVVPDAPQITATSNTCAEMFDLPTVTPEPGFSVQYSIDNGTTWSFTPSTTTPGCYSVKARYVSTSSCGTIAANAFAGDACAMSNSVYMVIFPEFGMNTMTVMPIGGNLETVTATTVTWASSPTVYPGFAIRYDLDGANSYTNTTGNFSNIDAGCHTVTAAYVITSACGTTPAGAAGTGDCSISDDFVVWPDLSADGFRPSITLSQNCGGPVNISTVDIDYPEGYSIPEGMEVVYGGTNNGAPYGPVTLSGLMAINFAFNASAPSPGCNTVTAAIRLTEACGETPAGEVSPMEGWTPFRPFVTFPQAPELFVPPVCSGNTLQVFTETAPPAGHAWYYRIINNTGTTPDTSAWQNNSNFLNSEIGCYTVEVTPVRTTNCFGITPLNCNGNNVIFPVDPQSAGTSCNPANISEACLMSASTCILPEPVMAITPNNITVCLGDEGKIDLQYFKQMVPQCLLVDPQPTEYYASGPWGAYYFGGADGAKIQYHVTSSDTFVVREGTYFEAPNNLPELQWYGENGENYPNVVTIGVTPFITKAYYDPILETVTSTVCTGPEVKFSITVQPNFPVVEPWMVNPNSPVQCEDNTGWIIHNVYNEPPVYEGYVGPFELPNWQLAGIQGYWTYAWSVSSTAFYGVSASNMPATACITVPADGTISFDWIHSNYYYGGNDSEFGVTINGAFDVLSSFDPTDMTMYAYNMGTYVGEVHAGDQFCYVMSSTMTNVNINLSNFFLFEGTTGGSRPGCNYELYFNPSTSPNAEPIGNALVQTIVGDGNAISFQKVYIPGVYEVWERCGQCAEKAATFEFSIEGFPAVQDLFAETCPNTPGGNTGTFAGLNLNLPAGISVGGVYNTYSAAAAGGASGLVSPTLPFDYTGTTGALYVRVGQDIDNDGTADCFKVATITLSVVDRPIVIMDLVEEACVSQPVTVTANTYAGSGDGFLYNWAVTPLAGGPTVTATTVSSDWTFSTIVPGQYEVCVSVDDANYNNLISGFTGPFAPENWTFNANGGNGSYIINTDFLGIESCDYGFAKGEGVGSVSTEVCVTVPSSGVVAFDWFYVTYDEAPIFDPFWISVNGVTSTVSNPFGGYYQSGNYAVNVNAGDQLCFIQYSTDCIFGPSVSISGLFMFQDGPFCPTTVCETINLIAPIITCPANFTVSTDPGECTAYQNLQPATVNDACADEYVIRYYTTGVTSIGTALNPVTLNVLNATAFNKGVTTVYAMAGVISSEGFLPIEDASAICSYTVTVVDTEEPHALCKNLTVYLDATGNAAITTASVNAGTYDNCMFEVSASPLTFTCANVGQNPVMLTATDMSGNVSTCMSNVTVLDITRPAMICPANEVQNVNSGTCGWTAIGLGVQPTDNCGTPALTHTIVNPDQTVDVGTGNVTGEVFAKGTSIVRYVSTDVNGNVSSCLFTVTVNDNIAPQIQNCPQDITVTLTGTNTYTVSPAGATGNYQVSVDPSGEGCSVNVSYSAPTASDNCPMFDLRLVQGQGAGTHVYTGGTNVERYVVTDMAGNSAACQFSITVSDSRPPVLTCPQPVVVGTNPDYSCGAYVALQPTFNDNCGAATLTHYFSLNGVESPATQAPYTATQASQVGGFTSGPFFTGPNGTPGTTLVVFTATDGAGNSTSCTTSVTVTDDDAPIVYCPLDITLNANGSCDGLLTAPYAAAASDNCGNNTLTVSYVITGSTSGSGSGAVPTGTAFELGTSQVTFTVTDAAGNRTACTSNVTVIDVTKPSLVCPSNAIDISGVTNMTSYQSGGVGKIYRLSVTGGLGGTVWGTDVYTDDSYIPAAAVHAGLVQIGQTKDLFIRVIAGQSSYTGTLRNGVNSAPYGPWSYSYEFVTSGTDYAVYTVDPGTCTKTLSLIATGSDNCSVASIEYFNPFQHNGPDASGAYGVGNHTIDWVITDGSGNTNNCSFSFKVVDPIFPAITCPADQVFTTGAGDTDCATLFEWTHPTPTDNCGVQNYSYRIQRADGVIEGPSVLSGNTSSTGRHDFPVGVSTVRYYVQDASGNQSTCKFTVTVTDNTPPVYVQCPVNFQATNAVDVCQSIVNWATPIAQDNCAGVTSVRTDAGPAQGQAWDLGVYVVSYQATDAAGNTAVCTFTVTVTDTQNPEIFCPSVTQTFPADKGTCTWNSAGTKAVAPNFTFDNCPATVTYVITGATTASGNGDATGVVFNLGKSTVTYTITGSGNKPFGTCSFDIIIVDEESPVIECANLGSLPKGPWINEFHYDNTGTDVGEFVEIAGPVGFNLSNCSVILYNGSGGPVYDTRTLSGLLGVSTSGTPVMDGSNDGSGVWGTPRAVGDNNAGWAGANAKNVYVTEDANYFYLGADVSASAWQAWAFAIDTKAGGGTNDSWSRQITYNHTNAPDHVFRGTFGGYAEFHTWNTLASSWTGYSQVAATEYAENESQFVEVRIAKAVLGADRIRNVQFYVTGDQNAHGTFDACPNDEIATSWNQTPKNKLSNYAALPQFATTVINYPSNGIQNGSPDGIALVCDGKVVQFLSYEGTFTAVGGAANGLTSTDIAVSQNGSEPVGSSLQFLGGGVNGAWVASTTASPGALNAGQVIAPTSSAVFNTDAGKCGATVAGITASAFDNCDNLVSITNNSGYGTSDASGFYPVGKHSVTFTATDDFGNTSQCSVNFEVKDTESPVVNCTSINPMNPQNTEVVQCESEFAWQHPVPFDNCAVVTYTYSITNPDGTVEGPFNLAQILVDGSGRATEYAFEKGTSTVSYFVSDAAGNKNTCSFNVTVADDDKPYFADCPTMIMVSNDPDKCSAKVNWNIPHAFDNCTAIVAVAPAAGNLYTPGGIVPVGTFTIGYIATDADGNTAVCNFQIMVIDTQEPEILVGKPQNISVECTVPPALVLNQNDVEDNCTEFPPVIGYTETSTRNSNPASCAYYNYTISRNWTVTDVAGNVERWNQLVTVQDTKKPTLTTPVDVTVECAGPYVAKSFVCNPGLNQFAPTAAFAQYGVASATDECAASQYLCIEFTETFAPGACGFTGVITRTWSATDPCGNKSTGVQKITIVDKTAPVFACKAFTVELDATGKGKITANDVINGGTAAVTDNCSANTSLTFQVGKTDFSCADLGVNQVLVVVKDACGNESACFAAVTVVDKLAPTILCPGNQSFTLGSGECNLYWPGAVPTTDNCSSVVTYSPSIANPFAIGTHVITATATDVAGNTATCSFTLTVKENIPTGTLACNDNVNVALDANCTARINPDMVLEGNSYRCFDNYCIEITTLGGLPHANSFDITDKDQTFKVSISDCKGTQTSCWGYVTIIETLVPEVKCPGDVTVTCNVDLLARDANGKLKLGEATLLTCKPGATVTFVDDEFDNGQCGTPRMIVNRIWTVTYDDNKTVSCTQKITMQSLNLNDIVWPADVAGTKALDCADVAKTPSLTDPNSTGWPMLNGTPVNQTGNLCNVSVNVSDERYQICAGSYELLRTWKVRNMCAPVSADNPRVYVQVIKVNDTKGPKLLDCPADLTVGVTPSECAADTEVPVPAQLIDLCSNVKDFKAKLYGSGTLVQTGKIYADGSHDIKVSLYNLSKGTHLVEYTAKDECGNATRCYVNITVIDASAPVAIAKQNVVLSLTNSGTAADGTGKLYTHMVDNGSYDHCTDVKLEIRRLTGGSCGNVGADGTHNNNSTFNNNNGVTSEVPNQTWIHPGDNRNDTDGGEYVQFCCDDIPAGEEFGTHDVELRVWDDANGNGVIGDNLIINGIRDNYNTTWATVRVENKLAPVLVCPPDVTVTCDMELNLSLDSETPVANVDLSMTGAPRAFDLCSNLAVSYKDSWVGQSNPVCKTGQIRRVFTVKKGAILVTCVQNITVNGFTTPFTVSFPQRGGVSEWDSCDFTLEDARNASDSRIKKPVANYGQCDIVGENITIDTFLFEDGACKKWRVTYKYINWCTGQEITSLNGQPLVYYYTYKDVVAPKLACNDQMFAANPNANNPNGGCEASVVLEASASDQLVCADQSWIKWQGFVDLWANGTVDRVGSSFVNKAWNGIWARQDKLVAGQLNPVWAALQAQHPNVVLADVVYFTYVSPSAATGGTVKLPAFTLDAENISHKVLWKVTDGCGNVDQCENTVMVVDKKAPTPYCVNVSTAIMQTSPKMVELWAKDFDKGSFDNCTPKEKLYFTFEGVAPIAARLNEDHFYKKGPNGSVNATLAEYMAGNAYKWSPTSRSAGKIWTACGDNIPVNVSVWDENFNTDYCTVTLSIIGCGNSILISGNAATEEGRTVNNVTVTFEANSPEFPKTVVTSVDGNFQEDGPAGIDYTVTAAKGGDYKNGVTTLDLVMIQRHILGLEKFTSPYKVIASDATNDGKVSASDLTEIRKLILGINPGFKNESWRFPVKGQVLNVENPFPYADKISLQAPTVDMPNQDVVAVKIGDVNGNVAVSANDQVTEPRNANQLNFKVNDAEVSEGEVVTIPVTAANFNEVFGYQMTLNLQNASFVSVQPGVIEVSESNIGDLKDKVTMSFASRTPVTAKADEVLFTLTLKSTAKSTVGNLMKVTSDVTTAEFYNSTLQVGKVSLTTRNADLEGIELFQNEPNPFRSQTLVSYYMPKAAGVKLSIFDVTGKVVVVRNINAVKGLNSEVFTREELGASGVLYYTLESGDFSATKKMIIVE